MLDQILPDLLYYASLPVAVLTKRQFEELGEYSCSMPSMVAEGRPWKRNENAYNRHNTIPAWLMGEYIPSPTSPETHCSVRWSRIEVTP